MLVDPPGAQQAAAAAAAPSPPGLPLEVPDEQRCLAHLEDEHPYSELSRCQRLEVVRTAHEQVGAEEWVRMDMQQTRSLLARVAVTLFPELGVDSWQLVGPKRGRRERPPGLPLGPASSCSSRSSPSASPPPGFRDRRRSARKRRQVAHYWVSALTPSAPPPAGGLGGPR